MAPGIQKVAFFLLRILSHIFCLSGIGLVSIGIWLLVDQRYDLVFATVQVYGMLPMIKILAHAATSIGCFTVLAGFFGYYGVTQKNRGMLGMFLTVLLLIILAEAVAVILVIVSRNQLAHPLQDNMRWNLDNRYGINAEKNKAITEGFDYSQYTYGCCGVDTHTDYNTTVWSREQSFLQSVPVSCCKAEAIWFKAVHATNKDGCLALEEESWKAHRYLNGCYQHVKAFIVGTDPILISTGISVGILALLEVLGVVLAVFLRRSMVTLV